MCTHISIISHTKPISTSITMFVCRLNANKVIKFEKYNDYWTATTQGLVLSTVKLIQQSFSSQGHTPRRFHFLQEFKCTCTSEWVPVVQVNTNSLAPRPSHRWTGQGGELWLLQNTISWYHRIWLISCAYNSKWKGNIRLINDMCLISMFTLH